MTLHQSISKTGSNPDKVVLNIQFFPYTEASSSSRASQRCFMFAPVEKELKVESSLWIGRKIDRKDHNKPTTHEERVANNVSTDRECMIGGLTGSSHGSAGHVPGSPTSPPANLPHDVTAEGDHNMYLAFRSKVVSRLHAKIWVDKDGQAFLKDTGSSSGTFLNRLRLSPTGKESPQYTLKSGDVIQFGVDYQGRHEEIYKAVTVKIFLSFKAGKKARSSSHRLKNAIRGLLASMNPHSDENDLSSTTTDCCICLHSMAPYQALFLAPCSHCFHYKCVTPLLSSGYMFQCPMCRQVANLEASVTNDDEEEEEEELKDGQENDTSNDSDDFMEGVQSHSVVDSNVLARSPPVVDAATTLARRKISAQASSSYDGIERTSSNEGSLSNNGSESVALQAASSVDGENPQDRIESSEPAEQSRFSSISTISNAQEMTEQLHQIVDALAIKDRTKLSQALDGYERIMKDLFRQIPEATGLNDDIAMVQARLTNAFSLVKLDESSRSL